MKIGDNFESALRAIISNKLRSALTMLGVVIGVGSVISMIGIGEGTKVKAIENIEQTGTNFLMVMNNWRRGGMSGSSGNYEGLKDEDVRRLKAEIPTIALITGGLNDRTTAKHGNRNHSTNVVGAEPQVAVIRNATKMQAGTWYTQEDEINASRKAVLGWMVAEELFQGDNAVGSTIRINNQNFEVIGVIAYKGGSGMWNPDDQVYIPLSTAKTRLLGRTNLSTIMMKTVSAEVLPFTQGEVERVLMQTRRNAAGDALFRVINQGEALQQREEQSRLLSLLLAGIASVSLLVGGIGIMNIMLVSVTERTKEIGLRKAIGARRETILTQFLLESVMMCLVGGTIGILLGALTVRLVAANLLVPPIVNQQAVVMAFGFSVLVGLFFGLYPALRASRLQPIEALRHE